MSTTESEVILRIAEALSLAHEQVTINSTHLDFPDAWDSMGTMSLVILLNDGFGVKLQPGETEALQSVRGILDLLHKSGKIV